VSGTSEELLNVEAVAEYLGVGPVTVYRWCRDGRLPCMKVGKAWRIRRTALEDFLRRREQETSLVGQLRSFYTVPDHVIAIAESKPLLHRLEVAFFQIGEARGAMLVKFYGGETAPVEQLRIDLAYAGLDVERLEASGQLRFIEELDPLRGRPHELRRLQDELTREGRSVWASFDWVREAGLDEALTQQEALTEIVNIDHVVVQTAVLEQIMDDWSLAIQRRAWHLHRGMIWISSTGLSMSRVTPLPPL
jgi:excisionase family DNA binding protein